MGRRSERVARQRASPHLYRAARTTSATSAVSSMRTGQCQRSTGPCDSSLKELDLAGWSEGFAEGGSGGGDGGSGLPQAPAAGIAQ